MMKKLLFLCFAFCSLSVFAQVINMTDGTTTPTCSGTFYDSGGTGNYSNNESIIHTICPDAAGAQAQLDFTSFNLEANADFMTIYNGPDTTYDVIGTFSDTNPGIVTASLTSIISNGVPNPNGCLTIEFVSDGANTASGWEATISCFQPCQTIIANIDATVPAADPDGIVRICQGDQVTFNVSGTFSVSGVGASYELFMGDGISRTGPLINNTYSTNYTFNDEGVFEVSLVITDANPQGCTSTNKESMFIYVSSTPDFTGTEAADNTLCLGESTTIEGVVTPVTQIANCANGGEETALGDVQGVIFTSTLDLDCFQSQNLTNIAQLESICIVMEHTYIGDLEITAISPNGQRVLLHNRTGSDLQLGNPIITDGTGPGQGWEYCFSMSAVTLLENGNYVQSGMPTTDLTVEAGTYLPVGDFNDFIGTPIDGQWTLEIIDHLPQDDGTVFSWSLNFDESLLASDYAFTPSYPTQGWDADQSITNTVGNTITVEPTTAGTHYYTYRVIDDFGCEYTEQVRIEVFPEVVPNAPTPLELCDDTVSDGKTEFNLTLKDAEITGGNPDWSVQYFEINADALSGSNPINPATAFTNTTPNSQIIYARVDDISSNGACYAISELMLVVKESPEFTLDNRYVICVNTNGSEVIGAPLIDTGLSTVDYAFEWYLNNTIIPGANGSSYLAMQEGDYSVTVTNSATNCQRTENTVVVNSEPPVVTATATSLAFANNHVIEVETLGAGDYEYSLDNGPWQNSNVFENVSLGEHLITARDKNGCGFATTYITIMDYPKFFTPNGDGYNDTWNITGINAQPNARIFIFDRYGKLLKQLSPNGNGWDGTFNGYKLPAADYWFAVEYFEPSNGDKKEFKAHFSLKR